MKKIFLLILFTFSLIKANAQLDTPRYANYYDKNGLLHMGSSPVKLSTITGNFGDLLAIPSNVLNAVTASTVSGMINTALTPYTPTASLTAAQINAALGYTAYNGSTNPNGYVTSASFPVASVFGRTGVIAAQTGDYSSFYYPLSTNPSNYLTSASAFNTLSKAASYTILSSDFAAGKPAVILLKVDCTSGSNIQTLPTIGIVTGSVIYITKTDATANSITIANLSTDNIITIKGTVKELVFDGTNWNNS